MKLRYNQKTGNRLKVCQGSMYGPKVCTKTMYVPKVCTKRSMGSFQLQIKLAT